MTAETIGSLTERLVTLERHQTEAARNRVNAHDLELEIAANAMSRVRHWMTLFLYFAGIPLVVLAITLAVISGTDTLDIRHVAANARASINKVLTEAQNEAANAKKTADDASSKAQQVNAEIASTEQSVLKLKSEVDARFADVQKLSAQVDASQRQLTALIAKANSQEAQFAKMTQQVEALQTARGVADIQSVYPVYGQHVAQGPRGVYIDPKAKPADAIYIDLNLSLTATPNVSDAKVGAAIATLSSDGFTVSIGPVYTVARVASGAAQAIGVGFDTGGCQNFVKLDPPCILYFSPSMKTNALKTREVMDGAQTIPDDRVIYLDPSKLNAQERELVNLSATDIVVVLGQ